MWIIPKWISDKKKNGEREIMMTLKMNITSKSISTRRKRAERERKREITNCKEERERDKWKIITLNYILDNCYIIIILDLKLNCEIITEIKLWNESQIFCETLCAIASRFRMETSKRRRKGETCESRFSIADLFPNLSPLDRVGSYTGTREGEHEKQGKDNIDRENG